MKKLMMSLLCVAMIVCFMPTMAWAAEGETGSALPEADSNGVITLMTDVKLAADQESDAQIVIPADKTVTIDLNGKTLTLSGKNKCPMVEGTGKLIIDDTSASKAGVLNVPNDYGIYAKNGGTIVINGGTINSLYAVLSGNNTTGTMNFEINGGTLNALSGPAIYMPGQVSLKITGGTLNGGISLRMGQVDISGGTINALTNGIDSPAEYYSYSGNAWLPDALYVFGGTYATGDESHGNSLNLNITGGTFNCTNDQGSAIAIYDMGSVAQTMNVNISGTAVLNSIASNREAYDVLSLEDIGVTNPKTGYGNPEYVGKTSSVISAGTFSSNPKDYVAEGTNIYKYNDKKFVVSATAPAHSAGMNTWTKGEDGIYTETYVSYSSGSTTTDNVTNKSENTTTGEAASTTADINASTTTKADGTKTTTATVDSTTAGKIVDKAVANKSEEVVVDATSTAAAPAAGTTTEVALPEKTVQDLAAKTDANVTIKTDAASVALDKEAVDAVAAQAGTTGTVKLVVETVKTDADIHQVELKLVTSNGAVTDFKGGNVAVTVKLDAALNAKDVVCVYIDDNGVYHKVNGQKNADGTYTFTTGHFSAYAVMSTEEAEKVFAQQDAKAADLTKALKLQARSVKTSKGNIKVALQADADDIKALEDLGYTVKYKYYRSTVKAAKYIAKVEKTEKTYTNTTGKKGTRYYYKARVMVYGADGQLVAKTALNQCKYACRIK